MTSPAGDVSNCGYLENMHNVSEVSKTEYIKSVGASMHAEIPWLMVDLSDDEYEEDSEGDKNPHRNLATQNSHHDVSAQQRESMHRPERVIISQTCHEVSDINQFVLTGLVDNEGAQRRDLVLKDNGSNLLKSITSRLYNTVVLGIGIALCLSPLYAQRSYLSSTNRHNKTGRLTLSFFYLATCFGFMFFSISGACLNTSWRPKQAMVAAVAGTFPLSAAYFFGASPAVLFVTATLAGFSFSCLSVVQGTYLTSVSMLCGASSGRHYGTIVTTLTSFMAIMHQLSQLLGNLVTSVVYQLTGRKERLSSSFVFRGGLGIGTYICVVHAPYLCTVTCFSHVFVKVSFWHFSHLRLKHV